MLMLAMVSAVSAQSAKYSSAMTDILKKFGKDTTTEQLLSSAAAFERVANAEKDQWLPYYYAALAQLQAAMSDSKANKDMVAVKVDELISKGEAITKNAEFYVLRYMNATMQMLVNPMERWKAKGAEAEAAFNEGVKADANNPRLYFLKGMSVLNTPAQFGGGPEKAKPLFEKAVAVGQQNKNTDTLLPKWGVEEAQKVLDNMK